MGTSSLQIGYIDQPLVSADWPRLRSMLTPALKPGRLSWSDIEPEIASDAMQVVAITRGGDPNLLACAVIRSALTPCGEALEIVAAAGRNHREWAAWGMIALRKAARDAGMASLQLGGRRVFPDMVADGDMLRIAA
jgi:hypothetical protein